MQVQNFGGLSPPTPKKIGGQKHAKFRSILYNFTLWSRISQERLNISKIGKLIDRKQFLPRSTKKVRWTLVHKWQRSICEYEPTKMHFFWETTFRPYVPWTIRTLDYSYHRWTIRTLDCSYLPGLFVPWTVRTVPGRFVGLSCWERQHSLYSVSQPP